MINKGTYLIPADRSGVWWVQAFHLYTGWCRKVSFTGNFIKVSVKTTKNKNWIVKKTKLVSIIIRVKKELYRQDGSFIQFKENNSILLKKRLTPKGKEIFGPITSTIKRKKFVNSFPGII